MSRSVEAIETPFRRMNDLATIGPRRVVVARTTTTHLKAATGSEQTVNERWSTNKPIQTAPPGKRTSWSGQAGTPQHRGLAAARADSLPLNSSNSPHFPRPPVIRRSAFLYVVRGFEYSVKAGPRVVRNQSVHLISESNATSRTAIPQRYPPRPPKPLNRPVNRLRIASIIPMKGANISPIPPRPPNKSPRIITTLLSLVFGLLVPCRFFLPHCGLHAYSLAPTLASWPYRWVLP